ncbi:hypothetical protein K438DRAFT_1749068 [Mycena galopus ATCC 62051]|nr:hypothetical protein K438DRAFT_1749068 [Mycena galopus ATCC 62051]
MLSPSDGFKASKAILQACLKEIKATEKVSPAVVDTPGKAIPRALENSGLEARVDTVTRVNKFIDQVLGRRRKQVASEPRAQKPSLMKSAVKNILGGFVFFVVGVGALVVAVVAIGGGVALVVLGWACGISSRAGQSVGQVIELTSLLNLEVIETATLLSVT